MQIGFVITDKNREYITWIDGTLMMTTSLRKARIWRDSEQAQKCIDEHFYDDVIKKREIRVAPVRYDFFIEIME